MGLFLVTFWGPEGLPRASPKEKLILNIFLIDFGSLLGPLLGPCCDKMGLLNFLKLLFRIFYPSEKHAFFKDFLRSLWDPLETVLGPFWVHFGNVLEAKFDANIDPDENVKNVFSPRRESKHQDLNASKKHEKTMSKRLEDEAST